MCRIRALDVTPINRRTGLPIPYGPGRTCRPGASQGRKIQNPGRPRDLVSMISGREWMTRYPVECSQRTVHARPLLAAQPTTPVAAGAPVVQGGESIAPAREFAR